MDFTIEEYSENIELTVIEHDETLEFSIAETVESIDLTIEEYNGADGDKGDKGDKPDHEWDGTKLRFEKPDDTWGEYVDLKGDGSGSGIQSIVAGENITVDSTDPLNPIISAEDGGTTVTKTSDLTNDGADGEHPYISLDDIPEVDVPTKTSDLTNDGEDGENPFITAEDLPDSFSLPEGNPGDVLVKGAEDWEASDRLTVAENEIDAEKNRNDTQDGQIAGNTAAIAGKVDKPTAPNNVPTRVINADGSTSDKGDFQLSEQIEISTNQTAQDEWKGKEIWVTASCTLTIPAPSALSAAWNIDVLVFPSATLTLAITSGGAWLHTTPGTVTDAFFRIARRGNTTTFKTLGL